MKFMEKAVLKTNILADLENYYQAINHQKNQ